MSRWPLSFRPRRVVGGIDAERMAWREGNAVRVRPHAEAIATLATTRGAIDLVAGHDVAVHWIQQPPAAVHSLQELQLVAAARCAHLHGGAPGDWWIAADWNLQKPFVCAALPRALAQSLQESAIGSRLRWHTAFGIVAGRLARTVPDEGWSALRTPSRVLLWHCCSGHADALTGFAVAADAAADTVDAQLHVHLQLESALAGAAMPQAVHWCASPGEGVTSEAQAAQALGHALLQGGIA